MDALRDWGHARDYVEVMWLMLQQEEADDFVISTNTQHSVRDFVSIAAQKLGIPLRWEGEGVEEKGIHQETGQVLVQVDTRYFRPTEVETLLGDSSKAREKLGWKQKTTFEEMVTEMVNSDLKNAEKDALCQKEGFQTYNYH
ncbi:MAG: hypothetical protein COB67_09725 [SAR324 cluster bacterium]|uniref:GDP-mannose 4,6-dehydratase n=1 Tax=SAR324 cluster bacterium TaxID=2024889 RepID=A0A2A4T0W4_9DELT|nr:MAG: hypothetical protein COB67_09725 [SAR324 cluster bacterium]